MIDLNQPLTALALVLMFAGIPFLPGESLALTPSTQPERQGTGQLADSPPPQPPDRGAPGQRRGAASRGRCPRTRQPLTALVPLTPMAASSEQEAGQAVISLTTSERPTFWFYVPYSLSPNRTVEFVLQDARGNDVYQTSFTESGTRPGVVSFQLPAAAPSLEVDVPYHWYFLIYCTPEDPVFVEGWMQRVNPDAALTDRIEGASPQEQVQFYREAGIWQDALTTLGQMRRDNPEDETLMEQWTQLLQSIELEALAQEPIISCCTPPTEQQSASP